MFPPDTDALRRSYPLLPFKKALAFPLVGLGTVALVMVLIGALDSSFELTCSRDPGGPATCTVRESTLFTPWRSSTFPAEDSSVQVSKVQGSKGVSTCLQIHAERPLVVDKRCRGINASAVDASYRAFLSDPAKPTFSARAGFSIKFFLVMGLLMLPIFCVPAWGLGGHLEVTARRGSIRVRRKRWLLGGREVGLDFPPSQAPSFNLQRHASRKHRNQGTLEVQAAGQSVTLASTASFDELMKVRKDLETYYAAL